MTLPIHAHEEAVRQAMQGDAPRLVLSAPTGSGKSTVVPQMVAEAREWAGKIIVIQPRRMAARLLAERIAELRSSRIGGEVGYIVRYEKKVSADTRIIFMTDGVLMRWLIDNPTLDGISCVIFDEFHERRIDSDIALAVCKKLQRESRPDLGLVAMSATLAVDKVKSYLEPCVEVNAEGRTFPVNKQFCPPKVSTNARQGKAFIWDQIKALSKKVVQHPDSGDWLVFLPGTHEIRKTIQCLETTSWLSDYQIYPLYSSLPVKQQQLALNAPSPKIIVATNVAETSITIPTIKTVIDSGVARESRFDFAREMDSLLVRKISQASAEQRAGRAGRVSEGTCYRLWSEGDHHKREAFQLPEIQRVDLSSTILQLAKLGVSDLSAFDWLEAPPAEGVERALHLLKQLGAIDEEGKLTSIGDWISQLPLPPRLGRLLLAGAEFGCVGETLFLAAYLQGEPLVMRSSGIQQAPHGAPRNRRPSGRTNRIADFEENSDGSSFEGLWRVYEFAASNDFQIQALNSFGVSARACRELKKSMEQLKGMVEQRGVPLNAVNFASCREALAQCVALAFSDRLAFRLGEGTLACRLMGNRKGKLEDSTSARRGELFFATEVREVEGRDVLTHLSGVVQVTTEQLDAWFPNQLKTTQSASFDEIGKRVVNETVTLFQLQDTNKEPLVIQKEVSREAPEPEAAAEILAQLVLSGKAKLPAWDAKVNSWITRLNQLAEWMPEMEIPPIHEDERLLLLTQLIANKEYTRVKELTQLDPWTVLNDWLSPLQASTLKTMAPTELTLSNGTKAKIRYEAGKKPAIGVQVQRLYGVEQTPTIANGAVSLTVEILAPNQRPWQITDDLPSFWENGFAQMKKDLAGRYPKHDWR